MVAAGVALGVTELAAGVLPRVPSFVAAMGSAVIDHAPGWFVRFGIDRFGTDDKPALVTGIVVLSLLIGAGLGLLARRRFIYAGIGFAAFGVLGTVGRRAAATGVGAVVGRDRRAGGGRRRGGAGVPAPVGGDGARRPP